MYIERESSLAGTISFQKPKILNVSGWSLGNFPRSIEKCGTHDSQSNAALYINILFYFLQVKFKQLKRTERPGNVYCFSNENTQGTVLTW